MKTPTAVLPNYDYTGSVYLPALLVYLGSSTVSVYKNRHRFRVL